MATVLTTTRAAQPRALLYDRVSTVMQAQGGYSGGAEGFQIDLCRAHSERKGYVVTGHATDVDSGAKYQIDGLMGALELAKRGEIDVLVVADSSRFARNLAKKLIYEADFRRYGVRVEFTNLPVEDSAEGRLVANMFGAYDEYEREKIAWRFSNGRHAKAKQGRYVGNGVIPFGYRAVCDWHPIKKRMVPVGLEVDEATAPIVRRIFSEARRRSALDIARGLHDEGQSFPMKAHRWTDSAVLAILGNPVYRGMATFGREGRSRADMLSGTAIAVPPIVGAEEWALVQVALDERRHVRRGRRAPEEDPYELRGMLACGRCGGALSARGEHGTRRYYLCLRHNRHLAAKRGWEPCAMPLVRAEAAEREAWRVLGEWFSDPEKLRAKLDAVRAKHAEARGVWTRRAETLAVEIERHEATLRAAVREKLRIDPDDPRFPIYDETEAKEAQLVARLRREHAALEAMPLPGLSDADVSTLLAFGNQVGKGIAKATPADRRWLFERVRLRGVLMDDREWGLPNGRGGVPWTARWESLIEQADAPGAGDSAGSYSKLLALSTRDGPVFLSLSRGSCDRDDAAPLPALAGE